MIKIHGRHEMQTETRCRKPAEPSEDATNRSSGIQKRHKQETSFVRNTQGHPGQTSESHTTSIKASALNACE
ncbi:hypothetical protein RRSWK_02269 [Rhodopirellula sp. SWK7]|nr:hypothetical protein RRSWK_02269 [Rhodopirellula sp. SWK7]